LVINKIERVQKMKKQAVILTAFIFGVLIIAPGCSGNNKKNETPNQQVKEQYQCPMKCSEEKFEKPGNCPKCGMELEKITNA
jgi:hypothetical protein